MGSSSPHKPGGSVSGAHELGRAVSSAHYLFKWLVALQVAMYLEAGIVPALLIELAAAFDMTLASQGFLGGIVYLTLSAACPIAGALFTNIRSRPVLLGSIVANNFFLVVFALTPTGWGDLSTAVFIGARAAVGFTQSFLCIYSPLWLDVFSPPRHRTRWIGIVQGAVPMGIMLGYALGAISVWVAASPTLVGDVCGGLLCWRVPFLVQAALVCVVVLRLLLVPAEHLEIRMGKLQTMNTPSTSTTSNPDPLDAHGRSQSTGTDAFGAASSLAPTAAQLYSMPSPATCAPAQHSAENMPTKATPPHLAFEPAEIAEGALVLAGVSSAYVIAPRPRLDSLEHFGDEGGSTPHATCPSSLDGESTTLESCNIPANVAHKCVEERARGLLATAAASQMPLVPASSPCAIYGSVQNAGHMADPDKLGDSHADSDVSTGSGGRVTLSDACELLFMPLYSTIVFALAALYFVVTGIQFWSTSYLIRVLQQPTYLVNAGFVVVCATGPVLGVVSGGMLVDRMGGYKGSVQRATALQACAILGALAMAAGATAAFVTQFFLVLLNLWLMLFFGGAVLPACTGIFISEARPELRPAASTLSVLIFNLCGYFLSPVLSGWIMHVVPQQGLLWGYRVVLLWSCWSAALLAWAARIARLRLSLSELQEFRGRYSRWRKRSRTVTGSELQTDIQRQLI